MVFGFLNDGFVQPDEFKVVLEKSHLFAGDIVRGMVYLRTSKPISCRSVKLRIVSDAFSFFWYSTGNGGDNKDKEWHRGTNHKNYFHETHTLWGSFYRTEELQGAGKNAVWGNPLSPNEGVLLIPCPDPNMPLILRVMDEDWGKRDDTLGEVFITNCQDLVNQSAATGEITFDLKYKGAGGKGTLTVQAGWQDAGVAGAPPLLRLTVLRALGMRDAEALFGMNFTGDKNDIYIQAYPVPPGTTLPVNTDAELPPPLAETVLPPGEYSFELPALKLPDRAPGSYEVSRCRNPYWHDHQYKHSHVRYYVEASIDIKWNFDPYVRVPFSVASRIPSDLFSLPMSTGSLSKEIFPDCLGCCELTCMESKGTVAMDAGVSRNGGAPGEWLLLNGTFNNSLKEKHADIVVRLECRSLLRAEGRRRGCHDEVDLLRMRVEPGTTTTLAAYPFQLPPWPASYHGGALVDPQWEGVMEQFGMNTNRKWFNDDPVVWWYTLVVEFDVPDTAFDLTKEFPFTLCSIPKMPQAYAMHPQVLQAAQPIIAAVQPYEGGMFSGGDDDEPPQQIPIVMATAVPLDDASQAPLTWGVQPGLELTEHRMDFDGVQRNPIGAPAYTVAFPVATANKPAISEADAAYTNLNGGMGPAAVATPQMEVMVRSDN